MTSYQDKAGIWVLYDYDVGPYIIAQAIDVVPLARRAAQQAYGRVAFWPYDMDFREAIDWWEDNKQNEVKIDLDKSVVHFFYTDVPGVQVPFCQDVKRDEWVMFDHTAKGFICPDCQVKAGWTVEDA